MEHVEKVASQGQKKTRVVPEKPNRKDEKDEHVEKDVDSARNCHSTII